MHQKTNAYGSLLVYHSESVHSALKESAAEFVSVDTHRYEAGKNYIFTEIRIGKLT